MPLLKGTRSCIVLKSLFPKAPCTYIVQRDSYMIALRPKYRPYSYMEPLGSFCYPPVLLGACFLCACRCPTERHLKGAAEFRNGKKAATVLLMGGPTMWD